MKLTHSIAAALLTLMLTGCAAATGAPVTQPAVGQSAPATQGAQAQSYFTRAGQHPEQALIAVMDGSRQTLDVAIYSLTKADIVKAMLDAKKRGVVVRVITDEQQSSGRTQAEALKTLRAANIPIKLNTHSGLMHLKVTIADMQVVTTGSFNYSGAASTTNDEVLVVLHDPAMAVAWSQQFQRMWDDKANFTDVK